MRAAPRSLLLLASAVAAPLGAQAARQMPVPPARPAAEAPQAPSGTGTNVIVREKWVDSIAEQQIELLADSIDLIASRIADARMKGLKAGQLGELQGRLGALEGRLGALHGRLGAMQGELGAMEVNVGELPRVHPPMIRVKHPLNPHELTALLKRVRQDPHGAELPPQDSITNGNFTVAAGATAGRVASLGQLDVYGTVDGDAVALNGDVVVHKGGHITGDALSVGGTVRLDGGVVDGELRSLDQAIAPAAVSAASSSGFLGILDELQTAMGWLVVMVLLGFGAMVFAEDRLRVVASAIETRFGRSLLMGIVAEVSFIPVLVLAIVLLVVTLIGIILLPVAIPGLFVLAALLSALGFLAVSRVAGQALTRRAATVSVRGAELRSMLAGLFFFFGLWLVAAILSWVPVLGSLLHALAFVVTWAAATVGLGAAVVTRGGGRPMSAPIIAAPEGAELGWQTPTPISGIAAARRQATNTPEV
jgi:hypothetical protein